jgi:RNA-directed DNA polymerase
VQEGGDVTDTNEGRAPVAVPEEARRAGEAEVPARSYAEPSVWTERMLATLEEGVRGGKWYSLMDKVHAERTLRAAFARVKANRGASGVDHVTVEMFEAELDDNLHRLGGELRTGEYRPQAIRRHYIPKPGSAQKRPLGIPTVRDRVVQTALRLVLEPIFERDFATHSYGFRPGRGCKDALRRVDELLKEGAVFVVDADLKSFFDTIPHDRLLAEVGRKVSDGKIMKLLQQFLRQGVLDGLAVWTPEEGTPQGAVISPLLSNIYLDPLDHLLAAEGFEMVRYADDFVVLCRSEAQAAQALAAIATWTAQAGLTLHPDKTRLIDARTQSFDFLGYRFEGGRRWPRDKSLTKLRDIVRAKTRRTAGQSLRSIIEGLNPVLRGWFAYFLNSYRTTFSALDGWIRGRLRSLLRHHRGGRGIALGDDHHRWPNAFFAEHGLFSLQRAHALAGQSPCG